MIICYHRSSSLGAFEFCQMKYFFQYVLGFKDRTNKKALMGTIVHRALQVLGDKKVAITKGEDKVENDDIRDLTLEECDDIDTITKLCFDHYDSYEKEVGLSKKELKTCFDYFTSLANSRLASRDAYTTSGNMELSGGGRLSYRDNINREVYSVSGDGSFGQITSLIIRGN